MEEYVELESGHMEFLVRALDGESPKMEASTLPNLPVEPLPELVQEAASFLRRTKLVIEPRKRWPVGGLPTFRVQGDISDKLQAEDGKALCNWRDAGWGDLVRQGKYKDGLFADDLLGACSEMVANWSPQPPPEWVTCIPSRRHPELVPDFARRLANQLELPFHQVLQKTEDRAEQKSMANSTHQARNVDGSLAISSQSIPQGPVLLLDDMVDSGWTMTVAAWLLRSTGSGRVWPLALALTGGRT